MQHAQFTLQTPTEEQLTSYEVKDAFGAFFYALCNLTTRHTHSTPNYRELGHVLPAENFTLHVFGLPPMDLNQALEFIGTLHRATNTLGEHHITTLVSNNPNPDCIVCLDQMELSPSALAAYGLHPKLKEFHPIAGQPFKGLQLAHYVRLTDDGRKKIAEWRISFRPSDFFELLD